MQKLLHHPITIAAFTVLAIIFYISLEKSAQSAHSSVSTLETLHQDTEKLKQEVDELSGKVADSNSELAKEKIIRNELLLQKPGEYVIQLADFQKIDHTEKKDLSTETPWEKWKKILL